MSSTDHYRADLAMLALAEFHFVPRDPSRTTTQTDITAAMQELGLVEVQLGLTGFGGWTAKGMAHSAELARSLRVGPPDRSLSISNDTLTKHILDKLLDVWGEKKPVLSDDEARNFVDDVQKWLEGHDACRTFLVPCRITPFEFAGFSVGPVSFRPLSTYATTEQDTFPYVRLLEMARDRSADWMAEIPIQGREQNQACAAADLAVDIAVGALQIVCGSEAFHRAGRSTGRNSPSPLVHCWKDETSTLLGRMQSNDVGLGIAGFHFEKVVRARHELMAAMGARLNGYLSQEGSTPVLNAAWCNAVFWYHQALAEEIETIAVAKLVISVEVLLKSEKSSGSTSSLKKAISLIIGLSSDHILATSGLSVEQFVSAIVRVRSRVLHGTWFALQPDLPTSERGLPRFSAAEGLVRRLLSDTAILIGRYGATESPVDDAKGLFAWLEATTSPEADAS